MAERTITLSLAQFNFSYTETGLRLGARLPVRPGSTPGVVSVWLSESLSVPGRHLKKGGRLPPPPPPDGLVSSPHLPTPDNYVISRAHTLGNGTLSRNSLQILTSEIFNPYLFKEKMGHREKNHKEWISQEAWQKIKERRNINQKLLGIKSERLKEQQKQVYKEADRKVKQLTRRDKRKYLEDMRLKRKKQHIKESRRRFTISQNRFVSNLERTWTPQSKTKMGNY